MCLFGRLLKVFCAAYSYEDAYDCSHFSERISIIAYSIEDTRDSVSDRQARGRRFSERHRRRTDEFERRTIGIVSLAMIQQYRKPS